MTRFRAVSKPGSGAANKRTSAAGGAPLGNKNAVKGKLMKHALIRILEQNSEGYEPKDGFERVAKALAMQAWSGEVPAIKEVFDRIDGKAVQLIGGDDESAPINTQAIVEVRFVGKADRNPGSV